MTADQFADLKPGDIVRRESTLDELTVITNANGVVTAQRIATAHSPMEWNLVEKVKLKEDGL